MANKTETLTEPEVFLVQLYDNRDRGCETWEHDRGYAVYRPNGCIGAVQRHGSRGWRAIANRRYVREAFFKTRKEALDALMEGVNQ